MNIKATTQSQLQQKGAERQRELEVSRQNIQQRIQDREKDVKELQQQKRSSDVKQQLRSQQETEVSRVKELQEKLEQEITELKRKDADLKQLSQTEDHNQFLHNYPSLSALSQSTDSSSIQIRPLRYFEEVTAAVSKLAGATYMDVHRAGGGIHFTVEHTRAAGSSELLASLSSRLVRMQRAGTTLVECKSGYGLELQTELKMLEVIEEARRTLPINISSTYCGAHAVPKGKTVAEATEGHPAGSAAPAERANGQTIRRGPQGRQHRRVLRAGGVFILGSTRSILQAGKDMGLNINFHGDELHPMNSAQLGAELGALAISHLEEVSDEGIAAMATAINVAAVLLPTTAYILRSSGSTPELLPSD
ncbi:hypothetical protein L3Q82_009322 [Scortum barcoo]|uniref:Uncharacterized protein n=1 Tax=Scortum barcoo TaxID=214431 RepID=A0ACB8WG21_9TELE|nr:hypothetical protein L3Q82_009322 [Scortum barcoo]